LRIGTGQYFEYRPLFSFGLSIGIVGAGFLAMGLFFSSITKSQIIAAILTAAVAIFMTILGFGKYVLQNNGVAPDSAWVRAISHISYTDVWGGTLSHGVFAPRYLIFHLSAAIFWLFATVKVLEARKWS